jgi:threonine aldolase
VPSGTFGNECAILTAGRPGTGLVACDSAHIRPYEKGIIGKIGRMVTITIECNASLFMDVEAVRRAIGRGRREGGVECTVLTIENPTGCGRIYPI